MEEPIPELSSVLELVVFPQMGALTTEYSILEFSLVKVTVRLC